ncbi:MAG: hypothetical protein EPN48_15855 [Microbacteriaceae bacterium]|nr:MAG: hypothetical protein EPN48_15855 [Microbacteriaceae bacterium]
MPKTAVTDPVEFDSVLPYQDASLPHVGNDIYGEMWVATLIAMACAAKDAKDDVLTSPNVWKWHEPDMQGVQQ